MMDKETLSVTMQAVAEAFMPHLGPAMQSVLPGKLAYAVGRNMRACMKVEELFFRRRDEVAAKYAEMENGKPVFRVPEGAPEGTQAEMVFSTPEKGTEYRQEMERLYRTELFPLPIHRFDRELMQDVAFFSPKAMVDLDVFFFPEEEVSSVPKPLTIVRDETDEPLDARADESEPAEPVLSPEPVGEPSGNE